jgi:CheY-like chemotaxis protein
MNEPLIWILAAVLTVGVVAFLLWLARRRQQRARDAAAHREAQRVVLEQAEHAARAQRVAADLARGTTGDTAENQALREVEAGLFQRLAEQRAEADAVEAGRARVEQQEAEQREARAQAAREAAEAEARRLADERIEAERQEAERLARAAEAEREAQAQAARDAEAAAAEAQRQAEERAEADRLEAARLAEERLAAERARAEREEAERLDREQAAREAEARAEAEAAAEAERRAAAERVAEAERRDAERRAAEAAAAAAEAEAAAAAAVQPTRELRADETLVLVADDSKIVRVKISRLLAAQGYRVALAESGEQALALLAAERPHLLITDVEMPGIDGFELTRQVRAAAATAELPVVMITSSDDKQAEAAAAGVTQLLGKPYSEEALIAAIEKARLATRVPA